MTMIQPPMPARSLIFVLFCAFGAALLFVCRANAQGCSDAGVCTAPMLRPQDVHEPMESPSSTIKVGLSNGRADHGITVWNGFVQYRYPLLPSLSVDLKASVASLSNGESTVTGASDLIASASIDIGPHAGGVIGVKFPLGNGGRSSNGLPLPMDLQPSLGTIDIITGVTLGLGRWLVTAAVQQPLTRNENRFRAEEYPATSSFERIASTAGFHRRGDIMMRISYPFEVHQDIRITPSLLPVYHIADDSFEGPSGESVPIPGSQGMTLNVNVLSTFTVDDGRTMDLSIGVPLVTRSARPDGLTRAYVLSLEYSFR